MNSTVNQQNFGQNPIQDSMLSVCRDKTNSLGNQNSQMISSNHYLDNNNLDREVHNVETMDQTKVQDVSAVPDSTTQVNKEKSVKQYSIGQDVLVNMDGCFYLGTINSVDVLHDRCLVKFGDNTLRWSNSKELNHLKTNKSDSGPLCVVCKTSENKEDDKVIVCDKCGRGYHQKCHTPKVLNLNGTWNCRRCVDQTHYIRKMESRNMRRDIRRNSTTAEIVNSANVISAQVPQNQLPYDLSSLTWDPYHKVNSQQTYCYCGNNGDWFSQMLQCARCRQWFHERCIGCLQYPLYCGDRFYVFVCSICNYGNEFVRRLEMKWVDLVHLLLFNLTAYNNTKYFDLDNVILPYANDNWHALQLSAQMKDISSADMREQILYALSNNKNRFKCGRENKKKVTIWGLRERLPPPAPCITMGFHGVVTDAILRESWKGNKRLQFLDRTPVPKSNNNAPKPNSNLFTANTIALKRRENVVVPLDSNMIAIMTGKAYRQNGKNSDSESVCSIDDNEEMYKKEEREDFRNSDEENKVSEVKIIENDSSEKKELKLIFKLESSESKLTGSMKRKNLRKSVRSDDKSNIKSVCPPTPPTSVSAPPTPPAAGSNSNDTNYYLNENSKDSRLESMDTDSVIQLKSMFDSLKSIRRERCDSSDETSSRCTLDSIIPPPKNFRGKNNPFHSPPKSTNPSLLKGKNKLSLKKRKNSVVANLFDTRPVVRTLKRKLSEKDLIINENGEVKRRKFRKSRVRNSLPEMSSVAASKSALFTPMLSESRDWNSQRSLRSNLSVPQPTSTPISNCVDYALNGRRLRQRQDITYAETGRRNSANGRMTGQIGSQISQISQIGQQPTTTCQTGKVPDVCMTDLKSSVNVYFGATNRILNGEKFAVQGRRINSEGKIQYLIEWEGGPS